ncbi:Gfo/Idh/MocA family oxidoreductase [Cocleimonas flava]|uniref:Putative dehydrogenase n=1 Tax=Cocleimonas flava TaxID=634765 RepID=A0A4V2P7U1_9GAMM|nr:MULTISPECIES: Gfo/Idh/MocA family oxidoreductase [Cocleimonas]MEB8432707.1 Gfo/Idh/MocA family oxidoreductase [Cocleimonas sp. KMM 6892]MEC4715566.1 Gfo/Idh/MocA family oxidoreductase [Cocleimonas sp. KMM 6895]MEC4744816.1 Gfo/Idh/MocA family oxidoreductase [Cocleimonas sp. KMM 6896]TCJ83135.1 putative dehydrogenase [Cocleimonas flava]
MSKKIRLGMVGGGEGAFIGAVHRIASRIDDRYELIAGALSSDPERAARSAENLGIHSSRSYSTFTEMAIAEKQREDGIDAVSIVTPNHMHFPVAKAFLEQGIAVISDKPLTVSLEEALELEEIVKESGCFFAVTHNYTGYPLVRQAKHMVETGELGNIRLVQVEYVQDWLTVKEEDGGNKQAEWRTDPTRSGPGGCLGDIGTHAFNLARFISGLKVEEVSADLTSFLPGRQVDDNVHVMMRLEGQAKGMLWSSQVAPGNENNLKIRIYGDKGGLEWHQENPNKLIFSPFGEPSRTLTRAGHGLSDEANRLIRTPAGHPEGYLEGFANIYTDIADALLECQAGASPESVMKLIPDIEAGISGMKFINSVISSSQENGKWVKLDA